MNPSKFEPKLCAECGAPYSPNSVNSKYCPECALKVHRRKNAERNRAWRQRLREMEANRNQSSE